MRAAFKASPHKLKIFGSPWSAPAWMKDNHKINNGGFLIGKPGEKYYKTFANYLVKYVLICIFVTFYSKFIIQNLLLIFK
jgi:glucosylceramidase